MGSPSMKILVSGCSLTAGWGFDGGSESPEIWPNILAQKLNAEITNVGRSGYDNTGIFLNALEKCTASKYDLVLLQLTRLNRVVVSSTIHGVTLLGTSPPNLPETVITKSEYKKFHKTFFKLNQPYEHWIRLLKIIKTVQQLNKQGYNIKFINGLLDWKEEFFTNPTSEFLKYLIGFNNLPDDDIQKISKIINLDKQDIDLDLWVNPFSTFLNLKVDSLSDTDEHPGPKSQKLFADMFLNNLNL